MRTILISVVVSLVRLSLRPSSVSDAYECSVVAHKIYGVPQTINSANYVYFLAYQELQRIRPSKPGYKVEEAVTGASVLSFVQG